MLPFTLPDGEETASLVVRYRGDGSSGAKPILLLAHMDVVDALAQDCVRDPFTLTEAGISTYGVMGVFIRDSDQFAHGLDERVEVRSSSTPSSSGTSCVGAGRAAHEAVIARADPRSRVRQVPTEGLAPDRPRSGRRSSRRKPGIGSVHRFRLTRIIG